MTLGSIVVGLMLLGLWLTAFSSWRLRNWRAGALAGAGSGAILLAGMLPSPIAPWFQAGLWGAVLLVFLIRTELVAVMSPAEQRFVAEYVRILQDVGRLKRRARETGSSTHLARFEIAVRSLERLEAPDVWAQLQADTATELGRRLTMMKLLAMPSAETRRAADARWLELEQRFRHLLKARAGFWNDFPHLIPRSRA